MEIIIVEVLFESNPKVYFFDPKNVEFKKGDKVVVETSRGLEYGTIVNGNRSINKQQIPGEIKSVVRLATEKDASQYEKNIKDKPKVLKTVVQKIRNHNLAMKALGVEYTLDRLKLIIYFTAAGRVDFRDLVKDLASEFKTRIELRQIHDRESVKIFGALGPCGRVCCCNAFLEDFEKTSIKMAKTQELSLNPSAISGFCGKLMCCLKYENEQYLESLKKLPKSGSIVNTPFGKGKVLSVATLREKIKVRLLEESKAINDVLEKEFDVDEITFEKE